MAPNFDPTGTGELAQLRAAALRHLQQGQYLQAMAILELLFKARSFSPETLLLHAYCATREGFLDTAQGSLHLASRLIERVELPPLAQAELRKLARRVQEALDGLRLRPPGRELGGWSTRELEAKSDGR